MFFSLPRGQASSRPGRSSLRMAFFVFRQSCGKPRASWRSDPSVIMATDAPVLAALLSGPPTVDRKICAGDRFGGIRAKIDGKVGDLVDGDEFFRRLCRQQDVALDLFFGEAAGFRGIRYLFFNERRPYVARTDAIAGDAEGRSFERDRLGQAGKAVLGGDISGLEWRSDQRMRRCGIDDAAPFS